MTKEIRDCAHQYRSFLKGVLNAEQQGEAVEWKMRPGGAASTMTTRLMVAADQSWATMILHGHACACEQNFKARLSW